jgi:hypothetical protein
MPDSVAEHLGHDVGGFRAGRDQQVQSGGPYRLLKLVEKPMPVRLPRTGIGEQFVGLVDRGENRTVAAPTPNELADAEISQPGYHLVRRPGAQQCERVRVLPR